MDTKENEKAVVTINATETDEKNKDQDVTEKATNYRATSIALIEKLLQFSTPRLDTKIVNVLLLEGTIPSSYSH